MESQTIVPLYNICVVGNIHRNNHCEHFTGFTHINHHSGGIRRIQVWQLLGDPLCNVDIFARTVADIILVACDPKDFVSVREAADMVDFLRMRNVNKDQMFLVLLDTTRPPGYQDKPTSTLGHRVELGKRNDDLTQCCLSDFSVVSLRRFLNNYKLPRSEEQKDAKPSLDDTSTAYEANIKESTITPNVRRCANFCIVS